MTLVLPIVIPLLAAALLLVVPARAVLQRSVALTASAGQLIAGLALFRQVQVDGYLVLQVSDWAAPFGITLVADVLSSILVVAVASSAWPSARRRSRAWIRGVRRTGITP